MENLLHLSLKVINTNRKVFGKLSISLYSFVRFFIFYIVAVQIMEILCINVFKDLFFLGGF